MSDPLSVDLVAHALRACRRAMRLERFGRVDLAEAVLRRLVSRAAAARDPASRQIGCESLARLCLGAARRAEAAVWHQQALSAWCEAGCPGAPDLALASAVESADDEGSGERGSGRNGSSGAVRAIEQARFRAAVGDWTAALDWLAVAAVRVPATDPGAIRRLRQSVRVLAAFDAGRGREL